VASAFEALPLETRAASLGIRDPSGLLALRHHLAAGATPDSMLSMGGNFSVRRLRFPCPDGRERDLILLDPGAGPEPRACLFYLHGGGFIGGDPRSGLTRLLEMALELRAVVVSPEYRLAPEHAHPGPGEDAFAALTFVRLHSSELSIDPRRILLVGASAGGGLAAGMSLMARDRGHSPVAGQLLIAPMIDDTTGSQPVRDVPTWDGTTNQTAWRAFLPDPHMRTAMYAAPTRAASLVGLPPTYLEVGTADLFQGEVAAFANRLLGAGVPTEFHTFLGGIHGFDTLAPDAELSQLARACRTRFARNALSISKRNDYQLGAAGPRDET